jgi:ABC-2 type transport system ATP-binding protein
MKDKLIHVQNIIKTFGDTTAVDQVSLQVRASEIYGLVGPDGAGKTTTMRLLCGALLPDCGEVMVGGCSMRVDPDVAREHIGYLSQRFSLYEELTVLENIRFFAEVRGIKHNEWYHRSMEILEFVGLEDFINRRAGFLSGGMKQKLGLASALVHRPQVLLLDEPTGGVDPVTRQDFWQLILRIVVEDGISVLVSTPYMDEAMRCTYVGFMREGKLIVEDTPQALCARLVDRILELRGEPLDQLRNIATADPEVEGVQSFGDRLNLRIHEGSSERIQTRFKDRTRGSEVKIQKVGLVQPTLEDVFIALLEADAEAMI